MIQAGLDERTGPPARRFAFPIVREVLVEQTGAAGGGRGGGEHAVAPARVPPRRPPAPESGRELARSPPLAAGAGAGARRGRPRDRRRFCRLGISHGRHGGRRGPRGGLRHRSRHQPQNQSARYRCDYAFRDSSQREFSSQISGRHAAPATSPLAAQDIGCLQRCTIVFSSAHPAGVFSGTIRPRLTVSAGQGGTNPKGGRSGTVCHAVCGKVNVNRTRRVRENALGAS